MIRAPSLSLQKLRGKDRREETEMRKRIGVKGERNFVPSFSLSLGSHSPFFLGDDGLRSVWYSYFFHEMCDLMACGGMSGGKKSLAQEIDRFPSSAFSYPSHSFDDRKGQLQDI